MRYENNDRLREYLDRGATGAYREHIHHPRFEFNAEAFAAALDQVRAQFPELSAQDVDARAAFRLLTSGVAPDVAVPLPSRWYRTKAFSRACALRLWPWLKLAWALCVILLCAGAVILLSALMARAEPTPENIAAYRNALHGTSFLATPAAQQPNGIILQFQQSGSVLATRPAGLVAFNCSTGMSCSFSGTTFTLTSTGGGGSGCVPGGATANALLYDTGSGTCNDVAKITWNNGTTTLLAVSGLNFNFSAASTFKFPFGAGSTITNAGATGQALLSNGDGTASFADPIVSGPDARGAAQTRNPVAGLAGIDYGIGCAGGPCVQEGKIDSSGNLYIGNFPSGFNVNNTPAVAQSGTWTVQPGNTANTTPWLFTINQGGNSATVSASNALKVDGSAVTQPVSGTVTANQGGTWSTRILGNAGGVMDAAGQNQTVPANELIVGGQFNSAPTTITSGNVSPIQLDSKGQLKSAIYDAAGNNRGANINASNQLSVSVDNIVANQSVNVAQVAGNTTLTGNGTTGTGAQRVTLSSDNSAVANWGQGPTGSAVPSGAAQIAGNGSGNLTSPLVCDGYAFYDASTSGATQLVALSSGKNIYICGYSFSSSSTTANTLKLVYGTGTNCVTGQTAVTPGTVLQAASSTGPIGKVIAPTGWVRGLKTAASNALCVLTSAAAAAQAEVWYTQF